jgi:hypothetical protein
MEIFNFSSPGEVARWTLQTDRDIGGFSEATFQWVDGVGVFRGVLSLDLPKNSKHKTGKIIQQTGYCVLRSPDLSPRLNLENYDALLIRCRLDNRLWVSQIKNETFFKDDFLFQAVFTTESEETSAPPTTTYGTLATRLFASSPSPSPAPSLALSASTSPSHTSEVQLSEWRDVVIPFSYYILTRRGRVDRDIMSKYGLLDPYRVLYVGFMMAHRRPGPFEIHLHSISAVRRKTRQGARFSLR